MDMSFILLIYLVCLLEELNACSNIYRKTHKNGPVYQGHGQPIIKYRYLFIPSWSSLNSAGCYHILELSEFPPGNSLYKWVTKNPTTWSKSRKLYYINSQYIFVSPKWIHCWVFHLLDDIWKLSRGSPKRYFHLYTAISTLLVCYSLTTELKIMQLCHARTIAGYERTPQLSLQIIYHPVNWTICVLNKTHRNGKRACTFQFLLSPAQDPIYSLYHLLDYRHQQEQSRK